MSANFFHGLCSVQDFEKHANKVLPRAVLDYYSSGACGQETLRNNFESFNRYPTYWKFFDYPYVTVKIDSSVFIFLKKFVKFFKNVCKVIPSGVWKELFGEGLYYWKCQLKASFTLASKSSVFQLLRVFSWAFLAFLLAAGQCLY